MSSSSPHQKPESSQEIAATYDRFYQQPNYFHYRAWLYRPFIRALIKSAEIKKGSRVLDVGCGQGFFTSLFAREGMDALGADLSAEGVAQAKKTFGKSGAKFEVGDALRLPYAGDFDCVFSRSCSLYNRAGFAQDRTLTDALLKYVRPGGVLIFDYYNNFSPRKANSSWLYHSLDDAQKHFSPYQNSWVCFSLRFDVLVLGKFAFHLTRLNALASRLTGVGGELIAIVKKTA